MSYNQQQITPWVVCFSGLVVLFLNVGCIGARPGAESTTPAADGPVTGAEPRELTVFAAASLADALSAVGAAFEGDVPGVSVIANYGSSSQLAAQLNEGAVADVFASANDRQMQTVVDAGRVAGAPVAFVSNRLTIIAPADNPVGIATMEDLAKPGVLLVLAAPGVPVRDYTDVMVSKLAEKPGYGEAFADSFYANLVSEEDNVRQVTARIALGEADAGIVYTSDVTSDIAGNVLQIAIPDDVNVIAAYPIAVLADAPHPELAEQYVDFVLSEEGQAILTEWGFGPPPADE